ncbi:Zn-finger [Phyllosticta citrichinensis]|uniref:Zn-finger n=1 Tax=Phyllosticta citrichinensis TaxID=1130410 RepID=A0ABR1XNH4_9PEZI
MAQTKSARKRAASPGEHAPQKSKRVRQMPTPQEEPNDAFTDSSLDSAEDGIDKEAVGENTVATPESPPLLPYRLDPNRSRRNIFHCTFEGCDRSFNRPCRLQEHLLSHTGERPFACTQEGCDKTYIRAAHLARHIKLEHTANERSYICGRSDCGKSFISADRLRRHQETHENKFHCTDYPPCNKLFRKHATLQRHIDSVHLGKKKYPCQKLDDDTGERCKGVYNTPHSLKAHEARVHGGLRFFCTLCGPDPMVETEEGETPSSTAEPVGFATYGALQAHIKEAHPPVCEHCGKETSTQRQLRAHVEIAHSGLSVDDRRRFLCPHCSAGFTKKGNLNVHIRSMHDNARIFVCGETDLSTISKRDYIRGWDGDGACGRNFGTKSNLEEHIRTQHLGLESTRTAKLREEAAERGEDYDEISKKRRSRAHPKASAIALLTGEGLAEESGRRIACIFANDGCQHRFYRDYDLEFHLGAAHDMSAREITEAMIEKGAREGTQFWIGGAGDPHLDHHQQYYEGYDDYAGYGMADEADLAAERELDRRVGIDHLQPAVDVHKTDLGAVYNYLQEYENL